MIPLHVKSHYSLGYGANSIDRLVERASALGLPALGLTDLGNFYGQVAFHRRARERGLRPITGVELLAVRLRAPGDRALDERALEERALEERALEERALEERADQERADQERADQERADQERADQERADQERGARAGHEGAGRARSMLRGRPSPPRSTPALSGASPDRERLVLLARNRKGYENLCRIISRYHLFGEETPPRPGLRDLRPTPSLTELLVDRSQGIFILSDSPKLLRRLVAEPRLDRSLLRALLIRPEPSTPESRLREVAQELGLPLVADCDVIFLDARDHELHRLQIAIRENALLDQVDAHRSERAARYLPGPLELDRLFADTPEALDENRAIAEACDFDLLDSRPIFPRLDLPAGETPFSWLSRLCFQGIEQRHRGMRPDLLERLQAELRIIHDLGFCEYFIVVGELVRFARERDIEVVGRGSGAGSLVTYVLGITNVDPLVHRLYFERFLHPQRRDLPDLDIDLAWSRRDEVIDHVYETYGHDRVAMIATHLTHGPRSALRETLKAHGVPPEALNHYTKGLPHIHGALSSSTPLTDLIRESPLRGEIAEEPLRSALPLAERLLGAPHHLSVHPGGIVITDRPIDSYAPLERSAKGVVVTQYEKDGAEDLGLVKIDLLGNRCLSELQETLEWVRKSGREPIELRNIPDEDPSTVDLLRSGRTVGCFQLESPAMRNLLQKMEPRTVRECIAAVALIRPGAAAGGAKESYIRRAHGEETVSYHHPLLRPILEENLGTVIYEEDVMCIAAAIAGSSLAEGDLLRSALKKARDPDELVDLENAFLERSLAQGVTPDVARRVWADLARFASYCFSKAHAAGYGLLAYQSAYLKAHHPTEFACALLNHHAGMYSTRSIAEEIRRLGVLLLGPCVNRSLLESVVEELPDGRRGVRLALSRVRGLSESSQRALLAARPFASLLELMRSIRIPQREIEALIRAGALTDIRSSSGEAAQGKPPPNRSQLLWELASYYRRESGQGQLGFLAQEVEQLSYPELEEPCLWERVREEIFYLGLALSAHPLTILRPELKEVATCAEARLRVGDRVRVAGLLAATRRVRTSRGQLMLFVTIEDEHDLLEGTLFPPAYRREGPRLRHLGPYLFEGRLEEDHRAVNLAVDRIAELRPPDEALKEAW